MVIQRIKTAKKITLVIDDFVHFMLFFYSGGGLEQFSSCLSKFTRYSKMHPLATLNYAPDMFTTASIVSSIEFDKDREFFAIAGVTKRIKVYDYGIILKVRDINNKSQWVRLYFA